MKKIQYILIAILAASCTQQPLDTPVQTVDGHVVFTASAADSESGTKTVLKEASVWWTGGDQINIFSGTYSSIYHCDWTGESSVTTFHYKSGDEMPADAPLGYWGVYPYRSTNSAAADGSSVTVTIPYAQTATAGTFDPNAAVSVAYGSSTFLPFYNVCGGVKFSVTKEGIRQVEFHAKGGQPLAGTVTVKMDETGRPKIEGEVTDPQSSILLTAPGEGTFQTGQWYYMACLPAALEQGYTMIFRTPTQTAVKDHPDPGQIKRSVWGRQEEADAATTYQDGGSVIFTDMEARRICLEHWDTNNDGDFSIAEAAAVTVTQLGTQFKDNTVLTNLDFLRYFTGLTHIVNNAFQNCSNVTSAILPNGITSIWNSAFDGCSSLASITIPGSVTSIKDYAFKNCSSLVNLSIPSTVNYIGYGTFMGCSSLTSISIPNGVTKIESDTFQDCSSLSSIEIPNTVTSIGNCAFWACSSLTGIVIPNSVNTLGGQVFQNCSSLTSITIPSGITQIYTNSFYGCVALETVSIPNTVTAIGNFAFAGCTSLETVSLPASVTSISLRAFKDCTKLESITMPGVTTLGEAVFEGCTVLNSVEMPSVTSIDRYAFWNCTALETATLPSSVTTLGLQVFGGPYSNLKHLTVHAVIPPTLAGDLVYNSSVLEDISVPAGSVTAYQGATNWSDYASKIQAITTP